MHLFMVELPQFHDFYQQLLSADGGYARACMGHWKQFLIGPPNKPHPDPYGIIQCVVHFLQGIQHRDNAGDDVDVHPEVAEEASIAL